ncbi:MAG TPA: hypothetical protein VFX06_09035 [Stellaceae bacterium]|nr:hypothetical protein [Stellaceae bacterium]
MTDFHALDHETRCYALVGFFLQAWALLESQISRAIAKALVLNDLQESVLQKNTQFRDKINILKTLSSLSMPSDASRLCKLLDSIHDYSHVRNMMAHDLFGPSETQAN